jgi:hypothetical protein
MGIALISLIACLAVLHTIWKYSGSGRWQLAIDQNGIQIYTMKSPGRSLETFRAVTKVKTTLVSAVAAMKDSDIASCRDWIPGCATSLAIEPWDTQRLYGIYIFRVDVPAPFSPREFLLKAQFSEDVRTNSVFVDVTAVPDRLPRTAGRMRVEDMHNRWRFTPAGDDEVEVELIENMDLGFPYFMLNHEAPKGAYQLFSRLPILLNKDKYRNEKCDFLTVTSRRM